MIQALATKYNPIAMIPTKKPTKLALEWVKRNEVMNAIC